MQAAQAAAAAEKAATATASGVAQLKLEDDSTEDLDPNLYFERRLKQLDSAKGAGRNPYPHKFHVSLQLPAFVERFSSLESGQRLEDSISVAGMSLLAVCSVASILSIEGIHSHTSVGLNLLQYPPTVTDPSTLCLVLSRGTLFGCCHIM